MTFKEVHDGCVVTSEPRWERDARNAFAKFCEAWQGRLFSPSLLREIQVGIWHTLAPYLREVGEELDYGGIAVVERPARSAHVVAFVKDLTTAQQLRRVGFKMAGFRTDTYGRARVCPDHEAQRWSLRDEDEPYRAQRTFMERACAGEFGDLHTSIDDAIDAWHTGPEGLPLHVALGLTWEEYAAWVKSPRLLGEIVASRKAKETSP